VALATLMYEILLTRIFSVTMWYHFAFVAISIAMFGMTVGAIAVYLLPQFFSPKQTPFHLALSALLFSFTIVLSFLTHLSIPFVPPKDLVSLYAVILTYAVIAVPFFFSGISICLCLTRFPRQIGRLYAADLSGAALGCILLVILLSLTDGPTAVLFVAAGAATGALCFALGAHHRTLLRLALFTSLSLTLAGIGHTALLNRQTSLLRIAWIKGRPDKPALYEKWNSFSRIQIFGDPNKTSTPTGWGFSANAPLDRAVPQLFLLIDATAGTVLTGFDGNLEPLDYLKYDLTNLAHHIRSDANVLAVGVGGGRDLLSALVFRQKSVTGVEINQAIVGALKDRFGPFTGHLDKHPQITLVNDEARSYIARTEEQYDLLQISLIDTWAATSAGAFVLSENALYTTEAWQTFLNRLSPNGILTVSRWYFKDSPGEMYRLTALSSASLKAQGIHNPRDHIVIVRCARAEEEGEGPDGLGNILVCKSPFTPQDLKTLEHTANRLGFEIVLSPSYAADPTFEALANAQNLDAFTQAFPLNIAPPTDNNPFFFHMLRLRDILNPERWNQGVNTVNLQAVTVLGTLLFTVVLLTGLCIIGPLIWTARKKDLKSATPLLLFFAAIGSGFMLVEISQMQHLIVFLGHPTYGLTVVLFSLLLSSGLGSFLTQKWAASAGTRSLLILLGVLLLFGILTPHAIQAYRSATTPIRIFVAILLLCPLGLCMGMAFPFGMKQAFQRWPELTPWFWGINGATSVCASVLAVVIALSAGISASFWTGVGCYTLAFFTYWKTQATPTH
ncbi:MAG: hypothetical protein O7G87_21775, partial [bacterium]|nr:hypothetical protein [bacterium]